MVRCAIEDFLYNFESRRNKRPEKKAIILFQMKEYQKKLDRNQNKKWSRAKH
jgi:hypothetical protein